MQKQTIQGEGKTSSGNGSCESACIPSSELYKTATFFDPHSKDQIIQQHCTSVKNTNGIYSSREKYRLPEKSGMIGFDPSLLQSAIQRGHASQAPVMGIERGIVLQEQQQLLQYPQSQQTVFTNRKRPILALKLNPSSTKNQKLLAEEPRLGEADMNLIHSVQDAEFWNKVNMIITESDETKKNTSQTRLLTLPAINQKMDLRKQENPVQNFNVPNTWGDLGSSCSTRDSLRQNQHYKQRNLHQQTPQIRQQGQFSQSLSQSQSTSTIKKLIVQNSQLNGIPNNNNFTNGSLNNLTSAKHQTNSSSSLIRSSISLVQSQGMNSKNIFPSPAAVPNSHESYILRLMSPEAKKSYLPISAEKFNGSIEIQDNICEKAAPLTLKYLGSNSKENMIINSPQSSYFSFQQLKKSQKTNETTQFNQKPCPLQLDFSRDNCEDEYHKLPPYIITETPTQISVNRETRHSGYKEMRELSQKQLRDFSQRDTRDTHKKDQKEEETERENLLSCLRLSNNTLSRKSNNTEAIEIVKDNLLEAQKKKLSLQQNNILELCQSEGTFLSTNGSLIQRKGELRSSKILRESASFVQSSNSKQVEAFLLGSDAFNKNGNDSFHKISSAPPSDLYDNYQFLKCSEDLIVSPCNSGYEKHLGEDLETFTKLNLKGAFSCENPEAFLKKSLADLQTSKNDFSFCEDSSANIMKISQSAQGYREQINKINLRSKQQDNLVKKLFKIDEKTSNTKCPYASSYFNPNSIKFNKHTSALKQLKMPTHS